MLIHADGVVEARFTGEVGCRAAACCAGMQGRGGIDWAPCHQSLATAVALPARGRTVLGQWASSILLQNLPRCVGLCRTRLLCSLAC